MARQLKRTVNYIKITIVILAIGLTLALFLMGKKPEYLNLSSATIETEVDIEPKSDITEELTENASLEDLGTTVMTSPRFSGMDDENRRWDVSAKRALHSGMSEDEKIVLEQIQATAQDEKGRQITLSGDQGSFEKSKNEISLDGGVVVEGLGLKLETEKVSGNLETKDIKSNSTVKVEGKGAKLVAEEFEIINNGNTIILKGGVKGRLFPNQN